MPPSEGICSNSSWCPSSREGGFPKLCPFAAAESSRQAPLQTCGEKLRKPWAGSLQWVPPYRWAVGDSCFFLVEIWGFCAYRSLQRGVLTVNLLGLNRKELEVTAEGAASTSLWEETGDQGGWLLKSTWQVASGQPVRKRRVSQGYHCVFPLHPLGSTPQRGQIDPWQVLLIEVSKCWLWSPGACLLLSGASMNLHVHCRDHSEAFLWPLEGLLIRTDQRLNGRKDVNIEHMDKREQVKWAIPLKPSTI